MKRWISTILSISLVVGMAAVLHACGKPKTTPETTAPTAQADESESESGLFGNIWEELYRDEDESYSVTEHTTDEHYQQEYDALTLPMAVTTQPVAGTTRAQTTTNPAVRETTTQFQFTSPSGRSTTKPASGKSGSETTAKADDSAAGQAAAAEETTTMLADLIGDNAGGSVEDAKVMPRPQVTYMDRYVTDILKSGVYTAQLEVTEDGNTLPIVMYTNGKNAAVEMPVGGMVGQVVDIPQAFANVGKVRFIYKDYKVYMAWTGGYMEVENMEDAQDMLDEAVGQNMLGQLLGEIDRLQYCGKTTGVGYVCETYLLPEENAQYNFYFTQATDYEGLARWDVVDLNTKQTQAQMVIRLTQGLTNKKAFDVSGTKYDVSDLEGLFGG